VSSSQYKAHPAAEAFPLLGAGVLDELVESMREHGFDKHKPIVRYQGWILDGRNRLRAAELAGVAPHFVDVDSECNPYEESWKHNGVRRDLEPGQRGAIRKLLDCSSDEFEAEKKRRAAEANRKRSEAASRQVAQQPRDSKGRVASPGPVSRDTAPSKEPAKQAPRAPVVDPQRERVDLAKRAGISEATAGRVNALAGKDKALLHRVAAGEVKLADAVRETKRTVIREKLEDVSARDVKAAAGVYDVIVLDPPWPMQKIERDERPNQVELDYPTMTEDELAALKVPCASDCHVWVWTTHKFLPMAFRLLERWGLSYVCTFVWHKPGGFQPIGLPQYNCEFALYARKGSPSFLDTKALPVCFEAPRGKHSEKPSEFYDVVRRVTAGRRLDMFNRRPIEGFDRWGNEA
jgi:N6-adenosine-specific RNA methylase IME4